MRYPDGAVYTGQFVNGTRRGAGKLEKPDGSVYEGAWRSDKQHGPGRLTLADGTVQQGKWFKDQLLQDSGSSKGASQNNSSILVQTPAKGQASAP